MTDDSFRASGDECVMLFPNRTNAMAQGDWGGLMAAAQQGHGGAYRRLLEETRVWLEQYYARRLPSGVVDDAVQDALIAVHEKRHTYDPARPFGPWLAAIARYKWVDRLRALRDIPMQPHHSEPVVNDHADAVIYAAVLNRLLQSLKPAQSQVISLVKLYGFSIAEAAARTGQSAALVKTNIHRGLARLVRLAQNEAGSDQPAAQIAQPSRVPLGVTGDASGSNE